MCSITLQRMSAISYEFVVSAAGSDVKVCLYRGYQCLKPVAGELLVLYDCWKMCVMIGAICSN